MTLELALRIWFFVGFALVYTCWVLEWDFYGFVDDFCENPVVFTMANLALVILWPICFVFLNYHLQEWRKQ